MDEAVIERLRVANNLPVGASILNNGRDPDKTTDRYSESDDLGVVQAMNNHGWFISSYKQVKAHNSAKQRFKPYLATYQNAGLPEIPGEGKLTTLQIGSHDGVKSLTFGLGFFRMACLNGLIVGCNLFQPLRLKHIGEAPKQLGEVVKKVLDASPILYDRINQLSQKTLTDSQVISFAEQAAALRFEGNDKYSIDPKDLLRTRRSEDQGNSLWLVFNRVQEHLLKAPDLSMITKDGKKRKAKAITNIDSTFKLNQNLWELAEEFLN